MEEIHFTVNGLRRRVIVDPNRSLAKVLREDLRLTGTKEGCEAGHCGTCAVLVEGEVVLGCKYLISRARNKHVITIEGIGTPADPHPLQVAFASFGAIQCGFCTPGMIIRAKWLLDRNPQPTREEIAKTLQPHLCRCTGYEKVFEAIEAAAAYMRGERKTLEPEVAPGSVIGQPIPRENALWKAAGAALFADDIPVAGCLHIKLVRSPYHHARILSIDAAQALSVPGVIGVLTSKDVKGTNVLKLVGDDQPVLCGEKVRMIGDPVAAVVATSEKIAWEAVRKVKVAYEELPPVLTMEQATQPGAPLVPEQGSNTFFQKKVVTGDVERGFEQADVTVEGAYSTQTIEHGYLERDTGIAYIHDNGQVVVMSGSQNIHQHRSAIAEAVGLPAEQVRVVQTTTGGAFGGKLDISVGGILALAATAFKQPVKLVFTREEVFGATTKRHPFSMKGRIGSKKDGTLTGLDFDVLVDGGAYKSFSLAVLSRGSAHAAGPYRFPNGRVSGRVVYTNTAVKGAMRGFGSPQYTFALESLMDDLARRLQIDPLELRIRNGYVAGDMIFTGQKLEDDIGFSKCLDRMRPHYSRALRDARGKSTDRLKRGVGVACVMFGSGIAFPDTSEAWAEILGDGRLQVWIGAADMGQGSDAALAQIAAEAMGCSLERVSICTTDTWYVPDGNISSGSRQTYVSGKSVQRAVAALKKLMEDHGCLTREEMSAKGLSPIVKMVHQTQTTRPDPNGHGVLYETFSFGIQMAEVEVDVTTGKVRVLKITAIHDLGQPINTLNVEGQTQGGIVMGLGYGLTEEYLYPDTDSFAKFRMPRALDAPPMEIIFVKSPRKNGPFGACGMGESVMVPTAPAIGNGVFDACSVRIRDLPITAAKIRAALAVNVSK